MHRMRDVFFFSSRRRHTRWNCDWSSDVCSSDLRQNAVCQTTAARGASPHGGGVNARGGSGAAWVREAGRGSGFGWDFAGPLAQLVRGVGSERWFRGLAGCRDGWGVVGRGWRRSCWGCGEREAVPGVGVGLAGGGGGGGGGRGGVGGGGGGGGGGGVWGRAR